MTDPRPREDLLGPDDLEILDEDGRPVTIDQPDLEDVQPPGR